MEELKKEIAALTATVKEQASQIQKVSAEARGRGGGKVDPDLVARDDEGRPYSVRYEAVNAMLLNEFLKEHSTVQEQQKEIDALKAQLKEQAALIQKVSARVEASNPALQTVVLNNP